MDRRDFFKRFAMGMAAMSFDPERLLWVPGAKTIFIPEKAGKIEIYDQSDLDAIKAINKFLLMDMYGVPANEVPDVVNPFPDFYGKFTRITIC